MTAYSRQGNKWTINEMLSLQREYEFLEMTITHPTEPAFAIISMLMMLLLRM